MVRPCPRAYKNRNMCGAVWNVQHSLVMVSLNINKTAQLNNEMQILVKKRFEIKNETEHQGQSSPKSIGTLAMLRCIFGQNLEILTSIGGDLSCGKAQNEVNFDFWVQFDMEFQGESSPKTIEILTKVFYFSGSNFVILA